ncbi:MAG: hypothetical protein AAFV88_19110 [Planctomycetota bacterium]
MPSSKVDPSNVASNSDEQATPAADQTVTLDRRHPQAERRGGDPEALDVGVMQNPRRKKQRRRHIDPTTCERDYSNPEIEFMRAMDDYKRRSGRMFPTCSEVLEVIRELGYVRLTEEQQEILGLDEDEAREEQPSWDDSSDEESDE